MSIVISSYILRWAAGALRDSQIDRHSVGCRRALRAEESSPAAGARNARLLEKATNTYQKGRRFGKGVLS